MKESNIEQALKRYCTERNLLCLKGCSIRGFPDRVILGQGIASFIEFKADGKKPWPLQLFWLNQLKKLGFRATYCDDIASAKAFIDEVYS